MFVASVSLGISVSLMNGAITIPFGLLYEESKIVVLRMTSLFVCSMLLVAITFIILNYSTKFTKQLNFNNCK